MNRLTRSRAPLPTATPPGARLAAWLAVVGGTFGTFFAYLYFVWTAAGQNLDGSLIPVHGSVISHRFLADYNRYIVVIEALAVAIVLTVGRRRGQRRRGLLSAALPFVVLGLAMSAQRILPRLALGTNPSTHNSFPSGHVALTAATVIAVLLVLPVAGRIVIGVLGAGAVAVVTVATMAAGWHRFSDGLAAVLISIAAGGLVVLLSPAPAAAPVRAEPVADLISA